MHNRNIGALFEHNTHNKGIGRIRYSSFRKLRSSLVSYAVPSKLLVLYLRDTEMAKSSHQEILW